MSEIFEEYEAILVGKGLIKEAQKESKKPNPRYDSLDLEAIEMLYGVKPDGEKDHILDQAHPEPVIIAPAYDRVNGLVENLFERQDIMAGIALKPNDGKLVQRRYVVAHDDLLNELLKTAFMLDKKGEDDLMKLADDCSNRLVKEAIWPWAVIWGVVKGVAWATAGISLYSAVTNNLNLSQGVITDSEELIEEIQEAIEDYPSEAKTLNKASRAAGEIRSLAMKAFTIRQGLGEVIKDTIKMEEDPEISTNLIKGEYDEEIVGFFKNYKEKCQDTLDVLAETITKVDRALKRYEGGGAGAWWEPLRRVVYREVVPSDLQDVKFGLARLSKSILSEMSGIDVDVSEFESMQKAGAEAAKDAEKKAKKAPKDETEELTDDLIGV